MIVANGEDHNESPIMDVIHAKECSKKRLLGIPFESFLRNQTVQDALDILNCIPETTPPDLYVHLLPSAGNKKEQEMLQQWLKKRVVEIDRQCGFATHALSLIETAKNDMGIVGLDDFYFRLQLFNHLLYDLCDVNETISFNNFEYELKHLVQERVNSFNEMEANRIRELLEFAIFYCPSGHIADILHAQNQFEKQQKVQLPLERTLLQSFYKIEEEKEKKEEERNLDIYEEEDTFEIKETNQHDNKEQQLIPPSGKITTPIKKELIDEFSQKLEELLSNNYTGELLKDHFKTLIDCAESENHYLQLSKAISEVYKNQETSIQIIQECFKHLVQSLLNRNNFNLLFLDISFEHYNDIITEELDHEIFELLQRESLPMLSCQYAIQSNYGSTHKLALNYIYRKKDDWWICQLEDYSNLISNCIVNGYTTELADNAPHVMIQLLNGKVELESDKCQCQFIAQLCLSTFKKQQDLKTNNRDHYFLYASEYISRQVYGLPQLLNNSTNCLFLIQDYLRKQLTFMQLKEDDKNDINIELCETALKRIAIMTQQQQQ